MQNPIILLILNKKQIAQVYESYFIKNLKHHGYNGQEPIRQDIFKCLDNRPSILKAREIGDRIIVKMKKYINIFIDGMTA